MSKEAVHYLLFNKKNYSREVLVKALRQAGYEESDISASVATVYGEVSAARQENKGIDEVSGYKIYNTKEEKIKDYIIGLLISIPCLIIPIVGWLTGVGLMVHYINRRRYRFYGLSTFIIVAIIALVLNIGDDIIDILDYFIF